MGVVLRGIPVVSARDALAFRVVDHRAAGWSREPAGADVARSRSISDAPVVAGAVRERVGHRGRSGPAQIRAAVRVTGKGILCRRSPYDLVQPCAVACNGVFVVLVLDIEPAQRMRPVTRNLEGVCRPIRVPHKFALLDVVDAERKPVVDISLHDLSRHLAGERHGSRPVHHGIQPASLAVGDGAAPQRTAVRRFTKYEPPSRIASRREGQAWRVHRLAEGCWVFYDGQSRLGAVKTVVLCGDGTDGRRIGQHERLLIGHGRRTRRVRRRTVQRIVYRASGLGGDRHRGRLACVE